MSDLFRFEISQVFLLENLCDVCLRKHFVIVRFRFALNEGSDFIYFWLKLAIRLKNCSCGQVVTGVGIL